MDIINIFFFIWVILILLILFQSIDNNKYNVKEGFTPKIRSFYHPCVRYIRIYTESFLNQYNDNYFIKKLKNLGIY
jgi:hypothetical protein